ncbi:unnamed protein product [Cuscuta epithymum]|uniref:Bidirectional sugar transporter SWEET n=2 Tax=Cuscuta epithymum TaxID=186058 RepID=A0AAV0CYV3_9ASTE|nr:unnamed protein product [Cuscuta epithymum]CAH9122699.1 unnamed protein product [Cuscuta epithymum]
MNHRLLVLRTVIGIIGNIVSAALFISPAPTVYRIIKNKSVEGFHPWPYHAALMNCLMWVFYAMPFVHRHSTLVMTINAAGIVLELFYLLVFLYFNNSRTRARMVGLFLIQLILLSGIVAGTLLGAHTLEKRTKIVGSLCVVFGIILYASPLSVMLTVIRSRSAKYLPGWLIASGFANGILWAAYACIRFDVFILVSNGVGTILSFLQILLKLFYGNGPRREDAIHNVDDQNEDGQNVV